MKSANPFSEYDLLPLGLKQKGKKKAQDGFEIPKPDNKPVPLAEIDHSPNLNLRRSSAHEQIHALLEKQKKPIDNRDLFTGLYTGLVALDNFLPEDKIKSPVVYPLQSYNPAQYGRGSQAIAKNGKTLYGQYGDMKAQNGVGIQPKPKGGLWDTNKPAYADSVLNANKNLNFVNRYLHPNQYPVINNKDGSVSTHLMASSDNFSYPTIIQDSTGKLVKMNPKDAYQYAMKNKEYIQFPSNTQADWFSANGYKKGKQYEFGGVIPGLSGTMYSRSSYKAKTKVSNKMMADYGITIGGEDPVKPLKQNVYKSQKEINDDTQLIRGILDRQNEDSYMVNNAVPARRIGEPKLKFVGDINQPAIPKAKTLPFGVTLNDVINTSEGYGYYHPQNGNFVPVDPSVFKAGQQPSQVKDMAKMKSGGWIKEASDSIKRRGTKGKCTPITKPGCTGRAKALAKTFKKIARNRKHEDGGVVPYYEQGGSYDMSHDQIRDLLSQGYELDIL